MATFKASTYWESWITQLRQPWMAQIGKRIWGAYAAALGDKTSDWGTQALLEHLPEYATSAASVALKASERQIDAGPLETQATLATRLTHFIQQWSYAGTPLGLLLALHFAGYERGVIITQNGQALYLSGPPTTDPATWRALLVVGSTCTLTTPFTSEPMVGPTIPAGNPWARFDDNTALCSRFAVLFPYGGTMFSYVGVATFSGTSQATVAWSHPFDCAVYSVMVGAPVITDSLGPITATVDMTTATASTIVVNASDSFTGTVPILGWPAGANPFVSLSPASTQSLRGIIRKWKPGRTIVDGVYVLQQGHFWAFPVVAWSARGAWVNCVTVSIPGPWS